MAHSVELLFDADTDAALRREWAALAEAGLPSQAGNRSGTNRPHVTLTVADRIDAVADDALQALAGRLPLPCVIGARLVFGAGRFTLARLIMPSAQLLALQADVHTRCLPHLSPTVLAHAEPGQWTPHTTLGRRFGADDIGAALAALRHSSGDLAAQFTGLRRWDGDRRTEFPLIGG
jgi:hypothetical protein